MSKDTGKRGKRGLDKTNDPLASGFEGISSSLTGSPDDRRGTGTGTSALTGSPDDR